MKSLTFKLLAFNLLLVFLPVGSFLYIDTYEQQLLRNIENSMVQQGRIFSAALQDVPLKDRELRNRSLRLIENLEQKLTARIRVIDANGALLADSAVDFHPNREIESLPGPRGKIMDSGGVVEIRDSLLYQIAVKPVKFFRRILYPPSLPVPSGEFYSGKEVLLGDEVLSALQGRYGAATRISTGGQRSVNLYSAIPIYNDEEVSGVVLVNQSTYRILSNLYGIRMDIIKIFYFSIAAALFLSVLLSLTITTPIKKLRNEAEQILDDNGTLRRTFKPLRRKDEIGSLSRSLNILSDRLARRIDFIESFYSDILHELKNPLTAIRSAAEILETDSPEWQHPFLLTIQEESSRINRILGELRELTRIDTRLENEDTAAIDLSLFTHEVLDSYSRLYPESVSILTGEFQKNCLVEANPDRLRQVLTNLLDNARSFSTSENGLPGSIRVDVKLLKERSACKAVLQVDDNGPGISGGNIEKIFQRFFSDRTDREDHAGLGLAICKAIVEGYGGVVKAENLEEGGARFTVCLPAKKI